MIGKVTRGRDAGGLLRYLYGPGRANAHTNAHLVASWLGDSQANLAVLEPPAQGRRRFAALADRLCLPLGLLPEVPDKHVWQCSMRLAPADRPLTDAEWASVARAVLASTGIAPDGDPGGCRWVAVRHADDHIHIVAVLARQDGARVNTFRDWPKVHAAARECEVRLGLTAVTSPRQSTSKSPTRAELEKAWRQGRPEPSRVWLAAQVRRAAVKSSDLAVFEQHLTRGGDVVLGWRYSTLYPGEVTGYRVGRVGDQDAAGQQVWYSGSKLGTDLSLPRLKASWAVAPTPAAGPDVERSPLAVGRLIEPLLPREVAAVLWIVRDIRRILHTMQDRQGHQVQRGPDQIGASDRERMQDLLRRTLDPATATTAVTSSAWPALATTLLKVERLGLDPAVCLTVAAGQRELQTATDIAAVLHSRLTLAHGLPLARAAPAQSVSERRRPGRGR